MSLSNLSYPASVIAGKACLDADDVVLLRKHMFPSGLVSTADAADLIAVHKASPETSPEWDRWLVETVASFIVQRNDPCGALDAGNARFLVEHLSVNGIVATPAELEILLHAMELAAEVPEELTLLALGQLKAVFHAQLGAYAAGRRAKRKGISQCDIDYVYRILRGSVRHGRLVLHLNEIAALEAIDALVCDEINHPAWHFLIKSIAVRDEEGHASPVPWLRMVSADIAEIEAA